MFDMFKTRRDWDKTKLGTAIAKKKTYRPFAFIFTDKHLSDPNRKDQFPSLYYSHCIIN